MAYLSHLFFSGAGYRSESAILHFIFNLYSKPFKTLRFSTYYNIYDIKSLFKTFHFLSIPYISLCINYATKLRHEKRRT